MAINVKLKLALTIITFCGWQVALAQAISIDTAQQPSPSNSSQDSNLANSARVVIEWATIFDGLAMTKTEISVDQAVVCQINADNKICDVRAKPGKREITLDTNMDFGTFSERYELKAGKRYKLEVVLNKKNFLVDSLFFGLPVSAMFNEKGKTASLKFELISVSDEP
jgi:hypothetical protein